MTTEFEQAWEAVDGVEGWMSVDQARALHRAARVCPPDGTIVEIGSFQGRSTVVLAMAAPDTATVVAIDPHAGNDRGPQQIEGYQAAASDDYTRFHANLATAGVADRVTHLRMYADRALAEVSGEIDVLYVDGAHRYGPARADIGGWGDRVHDGGVMLIHDAFSSVGVTLAIARELWWGRRFRYLGRHRSLAVYRADLGTGPSGRIGNALRQIAQLPWFMKNLLLKVALTAGLGTVASQLGRRAPEWPY